MTNQARLTAVAKADDVADLLNHIGWQDVVKPALIKQRTDLTSLLVSAVLGASDEKQKLTKEQLAGYIYGIDAVIAEFEKVLARGIKSLTDLDAQGFHLNANNLNS